MPTSTSATDGAAVPSAPPVPDEAWPLLPTETEIYILPDGHVVIADLPAELVGLVRELGATAASAIPSKSTPVVDERP